jgi:acetyl-CoA carboxylase carboxyltransferase component
MQLCDAFELPIVSLCDTPGIMVGPDVETTALVRHCNRMFVTGANLSVPLVMVVLRKAIGLGAMAMSGGNLQNPALTVSWPTGEFAGMGIEGSIKLGRRADLAAIEDIDRRKALFDEMVADAYAVAQALNQASLFEIDDVIDPADTRARIVAVVQNWDPLPLPRRKEKKRAFVDTW